MTSLATSSSVQTLLYLVLMVESDEPGHLLLCPDPLDCERLPRDFLHALDQVQLSQLVSNLKVISDEYLVCKCTCIFHYFQWF